MPPVAIRVSFGEYMRTFVAIRNAFLALAVLLNLTACSDSPGDQAPDPNDPNLALPGTLRVDLDGIPYEPAEDRISLQFNDETKELLIAVVDGDVLMTIKLANSGATNTHELGPEKESSIVYRVGVGVQTAYVSTKEGGGGSAFVASFLSTGAIGSFQGTLVNSNDPDDIIVMENGVFNLRFNE